MARRVRNMVPGETRIIRTPDCMITISCALRSANGKERDVVHIRPYTGFTEPKREITYSDQGGHWVYIEREKGE